MPLDVTEYTELAASARGAQIMAGQEPSVITQQLNIGPSSAQSAAFSDKTRFIRIHADVPCRVALGVDPVATASSMRLAASGTEYIGVQPGMRIAVISTT